MNTKPPRESVLDRFTRYVQIDTRSAEDSPTYPSTKEQWDLLNLLKSELSELGVEDAAVDKHGYVTGTVPSNRPPEQTKSIPEIGFIAHVDTSPAVTGTNVKPVVHRNYQGGDIVLPGDSTQIISPSDYPNLEKQYIGMDIVTSDGTTLLGADDKAGVAEIMTAVDVLMQNPEIPHGTIKIAFTPDEEIGGGTKYFDVEGFGARFAYTMDGGPLGELQKETFNAFLATIHVDGVGVHPGYAKDKMVNAIRVLAEIVSNLPEEMSPEQTDGREGYIHPYDLKGQTEEVTLKIILRDFEMEGIERQKRILSDIVEKARAHHPHSAIDLRIEEQYLNMRYPLEKEPHLIEYAEEAVRRSGVEPYQTVIRGGTDGARLTYMGLPTPNVFAGGEAFHSKREWVPVQVMEKAVEAIVNIAAVWAEKEGGA